MRMTINNKPVVVEEVPNIAKILNLLDNGESVLVTTTELDYMFINQNGDNKMVICCLENPFFEIVDISFNRIDFFVGDLAIDEISIIEDITMNLRTKVVG